jgi:hypothetical protein
LSRSVAFQIWIIGALVPLGLLLTGDGGRHDFVAFWAAGEQVWSGNAQAVYNSSATIPIVRQLGLSDGTIFPYPPHALFIFSPFALVAYWPAYLLWNLLTAAFFYWCARPYFHGRIPAVLGLLTPAAITNVDFGQTGLLFGGLWLLAYRSQWPAVAWLTFKPHLGFLSILSLRSPVAFGKTALLAAAIIALSVIVFGFAIWQEFVVHSLGHAGDVGARKRWLFAGVTPAIGYGYLGWIFFAAAGALLLARKVNVFTAATASFLVSPYGFHYDMTVVCVGFGLLINAHWHAMPIRLRIPIALGYLAPVIAIGGAWWVPPLLLWALWAQTKFDLDPGKPDSASS